MLAALDALGANKVRSFLTMLGVIIGTVAILLLLSIGQGMRQYVAETFAGMGANLVQVFPGRRDGKGFATSPLTNTHRLTREDEVALRRQLIAADAVAGMASGSGTVRYGNRRRDTAVTGVGERFADIRGAEVRSGRFFSAEDIAARRRLTVLGPTLAAELFGEENPLAAVVRIGGAEFRVIGLTERRGNSLGMDLDDQAYIPDTCAMDLFGLDGFTSILTRARDRAHVADTVDEVTDLLRRRHGQEDFTVVSQNDLLGTLDGVLSTLSLVLLAIAAVSLLVGGIGIANIMLVSIHERTREIGVRRAVGAKRHHILWQFLVEAVLIGGFGGVGGLLLGAAGLAAARALSPELPLKTSPENAVLAVVFSAVVGILAGVLPARRAANMDPVEALRQDGSSGSAVPCQFIDIVQDSGCGDIRAGPGAGDDHRGFLR